MNTHVAVLSICSVFSLISMAAGAEAAECVTHPTLGVKIPTTHPGICVLGGSSPVGISQLTEEGLLFLVSESPVGDFNPPQGRGALSLTMPDAKIIFCPGDPGELVAGAEVQNCIENGTTFDAGPGAFVGRAEMLVSTGLTVNGETECPASVHARGTVASPTGGKFEISTSLLLFPTGIDGRCESVDRKVALSYMPPQADVAGLSTASREDVSPVAGVHVTTLGPAAQPTRDMPADPSDNGTRGIPEVLQQLAALHGKVDNLDGKVTGIDTKVDGIALVVAMILEELLADAPSTSATFCISQGRALELGVGWAAELKGEVDGGIGWGLVAKLKLVAAPSFPLVLSPPPIPPLLPVLVPVPTEAGIGFAGGIGRGLDICIELPLELSPEDQKLLEEVARDINEPPDGGVGQKGKFQRRARRILNYAALRVQGGAALFDRADAAADKLLDNGLFHLPSTGKELSEGLDVFQKEENIVELLATLDIPVEVRNFMANPEQVFDGLPNLADGVDANGDVANGVDLTCADLGISSNLRARNANLNSLCLQLEGPPSFEVVKTGLESLSQFVTMEDLSDFATTSQLSALRTAVICKLNCVANTSNCDDMCAVGMPGDGCRTTKNAACAARDACQVMKNVCP